MEISINGPCLPECHDLIEKHMDRAWGGKRWHFNNSWLKKKFSHKILAGKIASADSLRYSASLLVCLIFGGEH